jgi:hypothetical protein
MLIIKWLSTLGIIGSMFLTAYNIYPLNLYVALPATLGWIIVSINWKDKALIAMNSVALFIYILGVINYEI